MRSVLSRWAIAFLTCTVLLLLSGCEVLRCRAGFSPPPLDLDEADLVGVWELPYGQYGVERLQLRADGTFKQVYEQCYEEDYFFETPWNQWWLERLPDGLVRVRLQGARYFLAGVGRQAGTLYDPFTRELIHPINELVLTVRSDCDDKLILHHMWTSGDRGFVIFGGESEFFRRVDEP